MDNPFHPRIEAASRRAFGGNEIKEAPTDPKNDRRPFVKKQTAAIAA